MSTALSDFRSTALAYSRALKYIGECEPKKRAFLTETVPIRLPVKGADSVTLHLPRVMMSYEDATPKLAFCTNTVSHKLQNVDGILGWDVTSLLFMKKGGVVIPNREMIQKGILSRPNPDHRWLQWQPRSNEQQLGSQSSSYASSGSVFKEETQAKKVVKKAVKRVMKGGRKVKALKKGAKKVGKFAMRFQKGRK